MNITHYCSKCQCYHTDVPCKFVTFRVYACPACEESPCCCPSERYSFEADQFASTAHEYEVKRIQAAFDDTVAKLNQQQLGSSTLDTWLDEADLLRAHAWGVVL